MTGQTINYTYDPLYRLTAAVYIDGRYFHYSYDSVGNRLSAEAKTDPGGTPASSTYTYDPANHLAGVNGVSYAWDNNGNLLSDGTSSYEYDPFNRLSKVVSGNDTNEFNYDPQGDRTGQAVNGAWTYYDLDLNAGLAEVLTAQDEDYLYGLGSTPLAQNDPGDIDYLLTDGLGSVRQVVRGDSYGQVTLTESYDPYGNLLSSLGNGVSAFGYAGQWEDYDTGLMNMRARYYDQADGRFLTKDSWQGDQYRPISYNSWLYVGANPINYTDPTGHMLPNPALHYSCQNMPTKAMYELCILGQYGLDPISYSELGQTVQGKPGCYTGPTVYRAPGYLEGYQWYWGFIWPDMVNGTEVVYNFARMERSSFTYTGVMLPAGISIVGGNIYFGIVHGFRSDKFIDEQYSKISIADSEGIGIGIGVGRGGFQSGNDLMLGGTTWYLSLSASNPGMELNGAGVIYKPTPGKYFSYLLPDNKTINLGKLVSDIFSGAETPWPAPLNYINAARLYGVSLAFKYSAAYGALNNANN